MDDEHKSRAELLRELRETRERLVAMSGVTPDTEISLAGAVDAIGSFRHLLESMRAVLVGLDAKGVVTHVSPSVQSTLGYEPDEILGRSALAWVHEDDHGLLAPSLEDLRAGRSAAATTYRARHKEGHDVWIEMSAISHLLADGQVAITALARDVTEIREAQTRLQESILRHDILASASRDLITETDDLGHFVYLSETCADVIGYSPEELVGVPSASLFHPDDLAGVAQTYASARKSGEVVELTGFRLRHKSGEWRWYEGSGVPYPGADGRIFTAGTLRDVTERHDAEIENRRLQQRIAQTERLEGLGVVAGGIAHDFNNLLTPILGQAALAMTEIPIDSPARQRLERIRKTALRAAGLTNQMLTYAGRGERNSIPLDLSNLVREMNELLEGSRANNAEVLLYLDDALPTIEADPSQLSQIVMNLLTNAAEALDAKGGEVSLRTGTRFGSEISEDLLVVGDPSSEQRYVFLEVTDTGTGMDAQTLSHIFDPFYTTKLAGRGLGLASVIGIVHSHAGCIELQTEPQQGTTFRVYFPVLGTPRTPDGPVSETAPWTSRGTILIVDDDEAVRELAAEALRRCGFEILEAETARAAQDLVQAHSETLRAVVLDRTMPDASGGEAHALLRKEAPTLPILQVSGFAEEQDPTTSAPGPYDGYLAKPFLPDTLAEGIRSLLSE